MSTFKLASIPSVLDIYNNIDEAKKYADELARRIAIAEEKRLHYSIFMYHIPAAWSVMTSFSTFNDYVIERTGNYIKYFDNNSFMELLLKDPEAAPSAENTIPVIICYIPRGLIYYYPPSERSKKI